MVCLDFNRALPLQASWTLVAGAHADLAASRAPIVLGLIEALDADARHSNEVAASVGGGLRRTLFDARSDRSLHAREALRKHRPDAPG